MIRFCREYATRSFDNFPLVWEESGKQFVCFFFFQSMEIVWNCISFHWTHCKDRKNSLGWYAVCSYSISCSCSLTLFSSSGASYVVRNGKNTTLIGVFIRWPGRMRILNRTLLDVFQTGSFMLTRNCSNISSDAFGESWCWPLACSIMALWLHFWQQKVNMIMKCHNHILQTSHGTVRKGT